MNFPTFCSSLSDDTQSNQPSMQLALLVKLLQFKALSERYRPLASPNGVPGLLSGFIPQQQQQNNATLPTFHQPQFTQSPAPAPLATLVVAQLLRQKLDELNRSSVVTPVVYDGCAEDMPTTKRKRKRPPSHRKPTEGQVSQREAKKLRREVKEVCVDLVERVAKRLECQSLLQPTSYDYDQLENEKLGTDSFHSTSRFEDENDPKRNRTNFSAAQLMQLEETFLNHHYPDPAIRKALSDELALDDARVQVWFQNRRAKWRKREQTKKGPGRPAHNAMPATCSGVPISAEEMELRKRRQQERKRQKREQRRSAQQQSITSHRAEDSNDGVAPLQSANSSDFSIERLLQF